MFYFLYVTYCGASFTHPSDQCMPFLSSTQLGARVTTRQRPVDVG